MSKPVTFYRRRKQGRTGVLQKTVVRLCAGVSLYGNGDVAGMPYENPDDFCIAIGILNEAIENYPYERFGRKRTDNAPYLGMGAEAETGARTAVPVEKYNFSSNAHQEGNP